MKKLITILLLLPVMAMAQGRITRFPLVAAGGGSISTEQVQAAVQPTRDSTRRIFSDSLPVLRALANSRQPLLNSSVIVGVINGTPLYWGGSMPIPGAPATASTNLRYARDFNGLVGDGATVVNAALTNFISTNSAASKLQFEKGATYLVNSTVTLTPEDMEIDFNGATIKSSGTLNTTDTWVLRFGRYTTKHNQSVSFPVERGQVFFTYTNAAQLTVGDFCLVQGPIYWDDGNANSFQDYRWGWFGRIMRIDGNRVFMSIPAPGGINMDLGTPVAWTAVSVQTYGTLKNLTIKNLTIDATGKSVGGLLQFDDVANVRLENVRLIGPGITGSSPEQGLELNGAHAVIDNIQIEGLDDVPNESTTYPINVNGHNITVQNSTLFKGNSINSASRNINSQNINHYSNVVFATGSGAAISYHGNSSGIIDKCTLHGGPNSNSVVNIGASNTSLLNTTIYKNNSGPGITIADQVQTGITVDNVKVFTNITAAQGADANARAVELGGNVGRLGFGNITFNNCMFEGIMQVLQETRNLSVTNTIFQGKDSLVAGIFVESFCDTLPNLYLNNVTWRSGMAAGNGYNRLLKIEDPTTQMWGTIENCYSYSHPSNSSSLHVELGTANGYFYLNNNRFFGNNASPIGAGTNVYLRGNTRRTTAGVWNPVTHVNTALPVVDAAVTGRLIDVRTGTDAALSPIVQFAPTRLQGGTWAWQPLAYTVQ